MANEYRGGYCRNCQGNRKLFRPKANHLLHLLLSIITMGLWLIIWLGSAVQFGGWRCDTCGSKKVGVTG